MVARPTSATFAEPSRVSSTLDVFTSLRQCVNGCWHRMLTDEEPKDREQQRPWRTRGIASIPLTANREWNHVMRFAVK